MVILSYIYRFIANFALLALAYFSLNFISQYQERAIVAFLILLYAAMRVVSTLRQFHFFHKIERLEAEVRTLSAATSAGVTKRAIVRETAALRHQGELKAYMDLLFLALVALLCLSKIVGG